MVGVQINSIARKSNDFLTVKCGNPEDADKMEASLKTRFGDKLSIPNVKLATPQVKIVLVNPTY